MPSKVFRICDAYEAGYGKGQAQDEVDNPYSEGTDEREAWDIGYQTGLRRELDRFGVLPYGDNG